MGVLRSFGRLLRNFGYLLSGKLDKIAWSVGSNPTAMKGNYAEIIRAKKGSIQEYSSAVATLIAQREKKVASVKKLSGETSRLEKLKAGAAGKAKEIAAGLKAQGKTAEDIKADADFVRCQTSFSDFASTLEEKTARITELESDIAEYNQRIDGHKINLTREKRAIEGLVGEAADAVADMISAKEEKAMNDALSGISTDGSAAELEKLRDMRNQAKAEASVASELAGTDHNKLEAEFEAFATAHASNDEFDALIGLSEPDDAKIERLEKRLDKAATAE